MTVPAGGALQLVLDIGTHKVLGLAVQAGEGDGADGVRVVAHRFLRHRGRSMRDGQVHDVPAVARTIRQVKADLEGELGVAFSRAFIAAAGRTLKTVRGRAEQSHPHHVAFTGEMQQLLEWEAVANAQASLLTSLEASEQARGYYCIAHSATGFRLDGDPIGLLTGQRGRIFEADVLATFLPSAVVDALEGALNEAGLAMAGLTLEPIAVLEAIAPPTARHLNLVLVDIGAGTSDIAMTGEGTVQAYAMVPQAGDAVTEAVSQAFLLDFAVAERAKREASCGGHVTVENVLGEPVEITPAVLEEAIRETTGQLAGRIAAEIGQWTTSPPAAVLLVGGGSQTPGLAAALAAALDLPPQRVAVRDRRAVHAVEGADELQGPDAVTALGIALRAARGAELPPVRVRVDGRPVCLFLPDRCTVREAARIAGVPLHRLVGRIGTGITVTVNGDVVVLPGTKGETAPVKVNGAPASLDTVLANQDEVTLDIPEDGRAPRVTVGDMVRRWLAEQQELSGAPRPRIQFDGRWQEMPVLALRHGLPVPRHELVQDRDVLHIRFPRTARELLQAMGRDAPEGAVDCWVNGQRVRVPAGGRLMRNGVPARPDDPVADGDVWLWEPARPVTVRDALAAAGASPETTLSVVVNGRPVAVPVPVRARRNGLPAGLDDPVRSGDRLEHDAPEAVTLYQLLPHTGLFDDPVADGTMRRLIMRVGGEPAGYTTPIGEGDEITIRFAPLDGQQEGGSAGSP